MSYPSSILVNARKQVEAKREQAVSRAFAVKVEISKKCPLAIDLDREISTTSAKLSSAVLSKENIEETFESIKNFNLSKRKELSELLLSNGFSKNALDPAYYCNICNDSGILKGLVCQCLKSVQKELMYNRLGSIATADGASFESFELKWYPTTPLSAHSSSSSQTVMQMVLAKCKEYANYFSCNSSNLLLCGAPGTGKTHLSLSIGKSVIDQGFDVLYIPFNTLISSLESAKFSRTQEEGYQEYLAPVLACDLLILDDLGSEFMSPFCTSTLYDIINSRLLSNSPTIINTNLSPFDIPTKYNDRIGSRLQGCYDVFRFVGEDIRIKKRYFSK